MPADCSYVGVDTFTPQAQFSDRDVCFVECDLSEPDASRSVEERAPFDVIVMAAVVGHLTEPIQALRDLAGLLNDRGRFVVTTPSPAIETIHRFGGRLGIFSTDSLDGEHMDLMDEDRLRAICAAAGLEILEYGRFQFGLNQVCVARPKRPVDDDR